MKKLSLALLFLSVFLGAAAGNWAAEPEVRVTYVGNAGFLIAVGDTKVLIDAISDRSPGGYALPANVEQALTVQKPGTQTLFPAPGRVLLRSTPAPTSAAK